MILMLFTGVGPSVAETEQRGAHKGRLQVQGPFKLWAAYTASASKRLRNPSPDLAALQDFCSIELLLRNYI